MNPNPKHTGMPPSAANSHHGTHRVGWLLRRVVHATLDRLNSPPRDLSVEYYYRFPWF